MWQEDLVLSGNVNELGLDMLKSKSVASVVDRDHRAAVVDVVGDAVVDVDLLT